MFQHIDEPARVQIDGKERWLFSDGRTLPVVSGGDGPAPTLDSPAPTVLDGYRAQRATLVDAIEARISARDAERATLDEKRSAFLAREASVSDKPSEDERSAFNGELEAFNEAEARFRADLDLRWAEVKMFDDNIADHVQVAERREAARRAAEEGGEGLEVRNGLRVGGEPLTYREDNTHEQSFWKDLSVRALEQKGEHLTGVPFKDADERIKRHRAEMDVEMPERRKARAIRAQKQFEAAELRSTPQRRFVDFNPFERRTEPSRTDGYGGEFIPPLWMIDQYLAYLRAGAVTANLCEQMELPAGTDAIYIPSLTTPTIVGTQGGDGSAVPSQDIKTSSVTAKVKTWAGQSDIPRQLVEQSPNFIFDRVLTEDLMGAYNAYKDTQVIAGNGADTSDLAGGNVQGIYNGSGGSAWSSYNGITYTEGSPVAQHFFQEVGAAVSKIAYNRFNLESVKVVTHPRRWFWAATSLDANYRPLVEPNSQGFSPWNVIASGELNVPFEGLAGQYPFGPPAYIDGNITTTDATGGTANEDVGIVAKFDDCWLFEGEMHANVFAEVLSGTLSLRYQIYRYAAFLVRYGQSLAIITGTGMAQPQTVAGSNF